MPAATTKSFIALKRARRDRGNMNRRMSFHLDRQVVCINDVFSSCAYWRAAVSAFPRLHCIYTIRSPRGPWLARALLPRDCEQAQGILRGSCRAGVEQQEFLAGEADQHRDLREVLGGRRSGQAR